MSCTLCKGHSRSACKSYVGALMCNSSAGIPFFTAGHSVCRCPVPLTTHSYIIQIQVFPRAGNSAVLARVVLYCMFIIFMILFWFWKPLPCLTAFVSRTVNTFQPLKVDNRDNDKPVIDISRVLDMNESSPYDFSPYTQNDMDLQNFSVVISLGGLMTNIALTHV